MREGYRKITLGEVCDFQGGSQPPKEEWISEPREGYVRMLQIRDFTQSRSFEVEYVKESKRLKYCCSDDVLLGRYGASVGKVLTGLSGAYNVAIMKTIPNEKFLNKSLFRYFLQSPRFQVFLQTVSTMRAAQAGFSKEDIQDFIISVPPLPEQERIVAELDCLSSIIEKQKEQLKELDNLAQSIFYTMFGDPITNEKGWNTKTIKDVAPQQEYKGEVPCVDGKYWLLNLDMVSSNTGEIIEKCYFDYAEIGNSTITFNGDNVLYSKLRPYLNKVVIPDGIGYATSELVPLKPQQSILDKIYLAYLLRSSSFVKYISAKVTGAKMPRVSMNDFRCFDVMLPPLSLQQEFASKIEAIEKQKELIKQSIAEAETLFNSRMDYYFN